MKGSHNNFKSKIAKLKVNKKHKSYSSKSHSDNDDNSYDEEDDKEYGDELNKVQKLLKPMKKLLSPP